MLKDKYQTLIDLANNLGVTDLSVNEGENVLHIDGNAPSADAKKELWDEYARIDPDFRSGDLVLNINSPEADTTTYTVQSGDTLSKIGTNYGVSWQDIFETNRDKIDDPDKIIPGQELTVAEQFAELEKTLRADGRLQVDEAKLELSERILELMEDKGVTEAELARRLGKTRAYVNKVLQGSTNFTIKSLVKIGLALNCELKMEFSEIKKDAEIVYRNAKEPKVISKPKGLDIAKLFDFSGFKTNKTVKDVTGKNHSV